MARTSERPMWWRFIAPSILVLTLIVGILPAVQLGMEGSSKSFEQGQFGYKSKVGKNGTFIVLTQNAYQTMWIGHTWGPEIADEMKEREKEEAEAKRKYEQYAREHKEEIEQMKKEAARMAKDLERQGVKVEKPKDDKPGPAFLIIAYFLFVAAAIGLGYAMPLGTVRTIIFLSGTGLASLLLLIQVLIGFPLQSKFEEEMKSRGIAVANLGGKDVPKPFARQTIWLHLSWPILLGALGVAGAEPLLAGAGKKRKKKRRDDDDDDDDDRPRKKRRARADEDDDEDEDDRPRKKKRSRDDDDDDEDDRPRKKSRARDDDDEEEDDRPRKKSRARDDDEDDDEDDQRIKKRRR